MTYRNPNQGPGSDRLHYAAVKLFARFPRRVGRRVANLGEVADFTRWCLRHFGTVRPYRSREALWTALAAEQPRVGVEFGVAWGYATDWWLRNSDVDEWHGFDRFTGLPRAWHGERVGAFDAGGKPPDIDDPRVTWHVGDVEDTLPGFTLPDGTRLLFFDLDLYEPTAFAWDLLRPQMRAGDLLFFDEAMAHDERRVLDEQVLPSGEYDYVGSTSLALALRVR